MQRRARQTRLSRNFAGLLDFHKSGSCGFERTYLSRVERGILNPTAIRIWVIDDALKVPFHEIVRGVERFVATSDARRSLSTGFVRFRNARSARAPAKSVFRRWGGRGGAMQASTKRMSSSHWPPRFDEAATSSKSPAHASNQVLRGAQT